MHHQFPLNEVEAIRNSLEWTLDHILLNIRGKLGQLINRLHRILRARHAEGHLKLEGLDELVLEVVLLDHEELLHWFGAHPELKSSADGGQFEEVRAELVLYIPDGMCGLLSDLGLRFSDLKEDLIVGGISYLEVDELNAVDVVLRLAEEVLGGCLKVANFLEGESSTHCIYLYI